MRCREDERAHRRAPSRRTGNINGIKFPYICSVLIFTYFFFLTFDIKYKTVVIHFYMHYYYINTTVVNNCTNQLLRTKTKTGKSFTFLQYPWTTFLLLLIFCLLAPNKALYYLWYFIHLRFVTYSSFGILYTEFVSVFW